MDLNRNHYFATGLIVFLLGLQLRMVDHYVLNEKASQLVPGGRTQSVGIFNTAAIAPHKPIQPPRWLGYACLSVAAVLILQSLAMKKPGG